MNVLVACEESQRVCAAFRERGHNAFSCDIQEPSGGHPEWHILGDALEVINPDTFITPDGMNIFTEIKFRTMDGETHYIGEKWDLIIAHPPCTYLSGAATRHHSLKCTPLEKINQRTEKRIEAMNFFMSFVNADCDKICIENPRGVINTVYRQPDQIIDPYMFAESVEDTENYVTKATCLWLKNLPPLVTNSLPKPNNRELFGEYPTGKARVWVCSVTGGQNRAKERSKTFPGIAKAMAEQWGNPDDYEMQMMLEEKDV